MIHVGELSDVGVIDSYRDGHVSGWVRCKSIDCIGVLYFAADAPVKIEFSLFARPDLGPEAIGFKAGLPDNFSMHDFVSERLIVVVQDLLGNIVGKVRLWKVLSAALLVGDLKAPELKVAVDWLEKNRPNNSGILCDLLTGGGATAAKVSKDRSAIRADNGEYFLYRGSNDLLAIYQNKIVPERLVNGWIDLVGCRIEKTSSVGSKFTQAWIPEKSSFNRRALPFSGEIPSLLYMQVVSRLRDSSRTSVSLDFLDNASDGSCVPSAAYKRTDSHFSSHGAECFLRQYLKLAGIAECVIQPSEGFQKELAGDLSLKFAAEPVDVEPVFLWRSLTCNGLRVQDPIVTKYFDPKDGNGGAMRVFRNDSAPIDAKVIVFGNSFFERGNNSTSVSWWFSRVFKEFHFIWSSELIFEYLQSEKPDFVLCQTIERFMNRVPLN